LLLDAIALRDFHKRGEPAAGFCEGVEDVGDVLGVALKLAGGEGEAEGVGDFLLLAFGKIVLQGGIECTAIVLLFPFLDGLEAASGVFFLFLFGL